MKINAYRRPDGKYGIRNKVLILPTVSCSNETARIISNQVPGTICITNQRGCGQVGKDAEQTFRTLMGLSLNPNIYGTIIVGLGCETTQPMRLYEEIKKRSNKPLEVLIIQDEGGTLKTIEKGTILAQRMVQEMSLIQREEVNISNLILATNCGGSDATSGISANPALGYCSDVIVENGGTVMLGETTEFIGADHILAKRAKNEDVKNKILKIVSDLENEFIRLNVDVRGANPSPGNIKGGLTTLEEKSLGGISKGGTSKINEVVKYAEIPQEKGLIIMDTPGYDIESVTGMAAGGAQLCVFTTGRGTPIGNPIIPVIKITGNKNTYNKMKENIDLDVSSILDGKKSIQEAGNEILQEVISVCNGKKTKAESFGFSEIGIYRIGLSV
ncbi:Altronate dehydratase [Thermoanaerobacterium thermosaccharolyticum DSM 571]|uniref:Altronate dehydratase n=1 Tax=Thermoanaerobacterium thermosaccharolyticum (strain ATCC 7956 / DSM 571 / NCIMB 9385 / NCA 3814 / NCTC 13789 / WDCM 00135 / 2032) TaxID=580327 RepID=D9TTE5_THETC|nr:UxaA family hydrolase [Thermoanaerobacterium thermosaccharolyticum]ADL69921.1 Altronate dehydratase [Thermoanaerobacterium thermosaccharolyticum DSM 571]